MSDLTPNAIGQRCDNPVYRIKALEWEYLKTKGCICSAVNNFIKYRVEKIDAKYYAIHDFGEFETWYETFDTLNEAKTWCEQDWQERLQKCLEMVK